MRLRPLSLAFFVKRPVAQLAPSKRGPVSLTGDGREAECSVCIQKDGGDGGWSVSVCYFGLCLIV